MLVQLPFLGGLGEDKAPEYVDPSQRQAKIENLDLTKAGSLHKRLGMKRLGRGVIPGNMVTDDITDPRRIIGTKGEGLFLAAGGALYSYVTEKDAWSGLGRLPKYGCVWRGIPAKTGQGLSQNNGDIVCLIDLPNGEQMAVTNLNFYYIDDGDTVPTSTSIAALTIYDPDTGAVSLEMTAIPPQHANANTWLVQAFMLGDGHTVAIVYNSSEALAFNHDVMLVLFDTTTRTFGAPTIVVAHVNTLTHVLDACPFLGDPSNGLLIGFQGSSTSITGYYYDGTAALVTTWTIAVGAVPISPTGGLHLLATWGETVWASFFAGDGTGITNNWRVASWSADGAFTPIDDVVMQDLVNLGAFLLPLARLTADTAWGGWFYNGDPAGGVGVQYRFHTDGTIDLDATWPCVFPAARPIVDETGGVLIPVCQLEINGLSTFDASAYLLRCSPDYADGSMPVASVSPRTSLAVKLLGVGATTQAVIPHMSCGATTEVPDTFAWSFFQGTNDQDNAFTAQDQVPFAATITTVGGTASTLYAADEMGDGVHLQGAVPYRTDGVSVAEDGFFRGPLIYSVANHTGGDADVHGTFTYAAIYRWTDNDGNEHRSFPVFSTPTIITTGADISILRLSYTARDDQPQNFEGIPGNQVFADIYRTEDGGSVFFFVGSAQATPPAAADVLADPLNSWLATFYDHTTDTTLASRPLLYTTGGVLDQVNPPGSLSQTSFKTRIFEVDGSGLQNWFTQAARPGEAAGWNEELSFPLPEGGKITAVASMDDKLVLFKADSIWIVYGDGPSATGQQSDLTSPQRIATDVGALDWRSVVLTPKGLLFRAQAGFFLLDRGLEVSFVGKPVEDTLDAHPNVVAATLVPDLQQVRFACEDRFVIVYDYFHDAWTTYSYDRMAEDIVSASLFQGRYVVTTSDGYTWLERSPDDENAYLDDNTSGVPGWISWAILVPWVKVDGIQGYQRTRRALFYGRKLGAAGLSFTVATNYDASPKQLVTFPAAQLPRGQVEFHMAGRINRQESIQIGISDVAPVSIDDNGLGCIPTALALEVVQEGERFRQINAKR